VPKMPKVEKQKLKTQRLKKKVTGHRLKG
jgi:hypothetical protein